MGPGGFGPSSGRFKYESVPKPTKITEIPQYLGKVVGGFFKRLFYVFDLVFKTGKWIIIVLLLIAIIEGVMPIIGSLINRSILNALQNTVELSAKGEITPTKELFFSGIFGLISALFIYRFANRIINTVKTTVVRIGGELVVKEVKVRIMEKAQNLDLASFDMPSFYEKLENANREAGNRPISILNASLSIVSTVISFISYIILLSSAMPLATVCIIAVSLPSAIINFIYKNKQFNYVRFRSKERRQMNYCSNTLVNKDLAKEIRIFGLSDIFINKFKEVFSRYYKGLQKLILTENAWHVIIHVISSSVNFIFYLIFAWRVFCGEYKIGDYSLYTGSIIQISSSISSLISTSATIYEGTLFIDNLISFLNEKKTLVSTKERPEKLEKGVGHTIEFKNVSFSYPGTDRKVLKNIDLTIHPGESIVLVGLNGAGKTTLIKLLTRLYDPTEGVILLDGKDIREYDVSDLYKLFGIIFQDFGKYAFPLAENIRFGDITRDPADKETETDVKKAAIQANADEFISKLPDGYNTPLTRIFDENGIELSIGQWQKVCIARAFFSGSDILILDEPTASLDPMAEQEIFNQFDNLRKGKTTIFVSHRLSSATTADKIIVLEYGEKIEEGSHHSLMMQKGRYYELFSTQAKRYVESSTDEESLSPPHRHIRKRHE